MTSLHPASRYIWVRHTDVNGKSHVDAHLVWDAQLYLAARQKEADKLNADQKDGAPRRAGVQQITEDQYQKERT